MLNTEQKRQYRRKDHRSFCRFWLEQNDATDIFLCLKIGNLSTKELEASVTWYYFNLELGRRGRGHAVDFFQ